MVKDKDTWILYKTENLINHKIYVGVHKLTNTYRSRNYLGSGDNIQTAIKKYGRANFTRTTLAEFSCADDAYLAESGIVTEEFVKLPSNYNISCGGRGGANLTTEMKAKLSAAHKGKTHSEETKMKMSVSGGSVRHWLGKKLSEEHKNQMRINNGRNIPTVINEVYYASIQQAVNSEKITYAAMRYRLESPKSKWADWRLATEEEKLLQNGG